MADQGITPEVLLSHMQNMQRVLLESIQGLKQKTDAIAADVAVLKQDVRILKEDMIIVKEGIYVLKIHMSIVRDRLENVEKVQIPKLKKAVRLR